MILCCVDGDGSGADAAAAHDTGDDVQDGGGAGEHDAQEEDGGAGEHDAQEDEQEEGMEEEEDDHAGAASDEEGMQVEEEEEGAHVGGPPAPPPTFEPFRSLGDYNIAKVHYDNPTGGVVVPSQCCTTTTCVCVCTSINYVQIFISNPF